MICLDARTGKPKPDFGNKGIIDLTQGLGRDISGLLYDVTSPGVIFKNLIILGSEVGEGPDPAGPGHVRAFDVRTGKQEWIFHTIPQPGEFGHDTWKGDSWKTVGGANDWGGLSVDKKRGWVFLATGSCAFDFYGGQRLGQNLFANCMIALDASTGKRIWHYQVVHHDLWDRDLPSLPILCTVNHEGRRVDAVAQLTKFSRVFLLGPGDRPPALPGGGAARPRLRRSGRAGLAHSALSLEAAALHTHAIHRGPGHGYFSGSPCLLLPRNLQEG